MTDGPDGNERLTAAAGAVLLVLLAVEGVTILSVSSLLGWHVFVGMLLLGPVALKLASTIYRFLRYYTGEPAYRRKGPPRLLLRILGPVLVLSTIAVFGTGVALLLRPPSGGLLLAAHKASFVVWFGVTTVHVLAYVWRVPRLLQADWARLGRPAAGVRRRLSGQSLRLGLVGAAVLGGLLTAGATVHLDRPWLRWITSHHG